MSPEKESLAAEAQAYAEQNYHGDGVTGFAVEWENGEPVLKVYVDKKRDKEHCKRFVHKFIRTNSGEHIRTDVVEVGEGGFKALREMPQARAANGYDLKYNRIQGGLQIAPGDFDLRWVGTLGGIFMADIDGETIYGAVTNAHVTGLHAPKGQTMVQPSQSTDRGAFCRVAWVSPLRKNANNRVDAAVLDCRVSEGYWQDNERWTVHPEQFGGKRLSLRWKDPTVGMEIVKYGRTTGFTEGKVTSIGATDTVNYGEDGLFTFVKMGHARGRTGDMSAGGDSGSLILEKSTMHVVGQLFAGGGGVTIFYPIRHLIEMVNGRFAENPP